jgi:hypothetical protein
VGLGELQGDLSAVSLSKIPFLAGAPLDTSAPVGSAELQDDPSAVSLSKMSSGALTGAPLDTSAPVGSAELQDDPSAVSLSKMSSGALTGAQFDASVPARWDDLQDDHGDMPSDDDVVPAVTEEEIRNQVNLLIEKAAVNELDDEEISAKIKVGLVDNAFTVSNYYSLTTSHSLLITTYYLVLTTHYLLLITN